MREPVRSAVLVLLVAPLAGCALVVDLGPPKELEVPREGGAPTALADADGGVDDGSSDGVDNATLQPVLVAVGPMQACAIISDGPSNPLNGTVRCWGSDSSGELGEDPLVIGPSPSPSPVAVEGRSSSLLDNVLSLSLASGYSCAITGDGFLQCWGSVPAGLGVVPEEIDPAWEPSTMDLYAAPLMQVTTASVSDSGGCCTLADMSLVCWGSARPAVGAGIDGGVVSFGAPFESVVVGRAHGCGYSAPVDDVECWGDGTRGQAGGSVGVSVYEPTPVGVGKYGAIAQVAAGGDDSCALVNGEVYCWGANDLGQLGSTGPDSAKPMLVVFGSAAQALEIAMGDAHACALLADLTVWCWGDNSRSQLGQDGSGPAHGPALVKRQSGTTLATFHGIHHIAAGGATTCATMLADPDVYCWGDNSFDQAGQSASQSQVPYATRVAW